MTTESCLSVCITSQWLREYVLAHGGVLTIAHGTTID
jgi:hypothetical protein